MFEFTRTYAKQCIEQGYAKHPKKLWSIHHKQACEMAMGDMEKIDHINQIVDDWKSDTWTDNKSYECMRKIAEVLESGR